MKIRRVSADKLDRPTAHVQRPLSPRERKSLALERELESAIQRAAGMPEAAFLIELGRDEKASTVRQAFNRVRDRVALRDVNLFVRDGSLLIAKRPNNRGRHAAA